MIELADAYKEIEIGGQKVTVLDFSCEHCDQSLTQFSFNISVFLYGIAFLFGKKFSYAGVTCPKCFRTILLKGDNLIRLQQNIDILPQLMSLNDNYENQASISYLSSIINMPAQTESLIPFEATPWVSPLIGDFGGEYFDSAIATYSSEERPDLEQDYICSYKTGGNLPIGAVATVWWFKPEHIEKIVQIENEQEIRIFPRYVHKMEWYERYEKFCWQYKYQFDHMAWIRESSSKSFEQLRECARRENINLENLLEENPNTVNNVLIDVLEQNLQQAAAKDINVVSEFLDLLINYDPALLGFSDDTSDVYKSLWKSVAPFRKISIPSTIDEFDPKLYSPKITDAVVEEMADKVRANYTKSHVQEWAVENHQKFIEEYISLARQSDFSYGLVWDLKCRYLQQLHAILDKKMFKDAKYAFFAEGLSWTIIFNGKAIRGLKGKGFRYIQYLVMNPKKKYPTIWLNEIEETTGNYSFSTDKNPENYEYNEYSITDSINNDWYEKIDKDALCQYRTQISVFNELISDPNINSEEKKKAEEDRKKILSFLDKDLNINRASRKFIDDSETRKNQIAQAIRRAIGTIKKNDTKIADHFQKTLEPINSFKLCYKPIEGIVWQFKD